MSRGPAARTSSAFTVAGHDWAIVFYPDVSTFERRWQVDKDGGGGGGTRAHIDLGLVDQRSRGSPSYSFASCGASAGYARFMSKAEVDSSGSPRTTASPCAALSRRTAAVLTGAYRHVAGAGLAFLLELFAQGFPTDSADMIPTCREVRQHNTVALTAVENLASQLLSKKRPQTRTARKQLKDLRSKEMMVSGKRRLTDLGACSASFVMRGGCAAAAWSRRITAPIAAAIDD
ncbi:hypothetical protein HU200_054232 [Digitaria exilis]|uniref:MATH domain-containing protein n=1 Tax=Digitaria exilis TaxID=1010633 RepID=A0A835ALH8_9POAL|nr:hypothetical protein HU200_054232 [Digitaria exilis]